MFNFNVKTEPKAYFNFKIVYKTLPITYIIGHYLLFGKQYILIKNIFRKKFDI